MLVDLKYRVEIDKNKDPIPFGDLTVGQTFIWLGSFGDQLVWIKLGFYSAVPINNLDGRIDYCIEDINIDRKLVQECTLVLE